MDNIQYDPEQILNGFPEDVLKELAKKLKRRLRQTKNDIIQEILSPPKGKSEATLKVWQEINWQLRKELELFSQDENMIFSGVNVPVEERFKVGYMFTLSSNPEIKARGEILYREAEKNKEQDTENAVALITENITEIGAREAEEIIDVREVEEMIDIREAEEIIDVREVEEMIDIRVAEEMIDVSEVEEMIDVSEAEEMIDVSEVEEMIETREVEEMIDAREAEEMIDVTFGLKIPSEALLTEENEELQKRIRILENELRKAIAEGLKTKEQLEKIKIDMVALRSQWVREKEETGKQRIRVRDLEGELAEKEKEIEVLRQKLEQRKTLAPSKTKEQIQRRDLQKTKGEPCGEIDLALYQGRKALIFAERDNEVDIRLNALGIIPIWAMEIDWNRPRRRMSTCEIVLYKMNEKRLKKLDEIRDIARYWNIPCNELLNI
ncbi:hypothetical protein SBF1_630009 [Candidatus Desulfosporosinus infrequens]|uniref:Uncharacterized protein n=1 Tax=Candidatus Desulfosporosinus infrequens TaxID=2043169 RepID=A0A2U3LMJ6_9FIRM|nr:hypothetical protein SBF1_630009 [Candidatus Desulfosporosinus infrequens]